MHSGVALIRWKRARNSQLTMLPKRVREYFPVEIWYYILLDEPLYDRVLWRRNPLFRAE